MRVLFTIIPATAHLYPLVPLAWALQAAGHEVRIATHPHVTGSVTASGLTMVELGGTDVVNPPSIDFAELDRLDRSLDLTADERFAWDIVREHMLPPISQFHPPVPADTPQPLVDDLVALARDWRPDLVLWDPAWPASPVAARVVGAAHARLLWGPDHLGQVIEMFADRLGGVGAGRDGNPLLDLVRPATERYGCDIDTELLLGQWTVDPTPAGMRLPVGTRTVPMRGVPYCGGAALPEWLSAPPQRPRICLTLGLTARAYFTGTETERITHLMEMVDGLDIEVIATLNADQLAGLPPLPDNVRTFDFVSLTQLLPTCSAIVYHGNFGTFLAAAENKLPQLVTVEEGGYALSTAQYVEQTGAGELLNHKESSAAAMRDQLLAVLDEPRYRRGAERIYRDTASAPAPSEVVPVLERLTAEHRTTPRPARA